MSGNKFRLFFAKALLLVYASVVGFIDFFIQTIKIINILKESVICGSSKLN